MPRKKEVENRKKKCVRESSIGPFVPVLIRVEKNLRRREKNEVKKRNTCCSSVDADGIAAVLRD
jgi:hypothetical protein